MPLIRSWIESANSTHTPFPLNNLPCGVFSLGGGARRLGTAIGGFVLDVSALEAGGAVDFGGALSQPAWNAFMALGPPAWARLRESLIALLREGSGAQEQITPHLIAQEEARLHLPFDVREYTDFYASRHHAMNVGTMLRGAQNALPENWLHLPVGYNGRASSIVVSGNAIRRPWGQIKGKHDALPRWAPSERFDMELEMGAVVGQGSEGPISVDQADANIFGYVLLNDWSARDIQGWEYQPLGPFQAKATATTISPWIVTKAALEPFRAATPPREKELLAHLQDTTPMLYDIVLLAALNGEVITRTNYNLMYYSFAQQLAHHAACGCPMRVGDLLGSGTISGPQREQRGSLLELSWGGKEPLQLQDGSSRSFLEDGDEITLHGAAHGDGYQIGFGPCTGTLLPALETPLKG